MHIFRERFNQFLLLLSQNTSFVNFLLELNSLFICGHLSSKKKPEYTFWNWLPSRDGFRCKFSDFEQIVPSICNALCIMEFRCFIQHSWHCSHSSDNLRYCDFCDFSISEFFVEFFQLSLSLYNHFFHFLLES